jgi:hypothetical protein
VPRLLRSWRNRTICRLIVKRLDGELPPGAVIDRPLQRRWTVVPLADKRSAETLQQQALEQRRR